MDVATLDLAAKLAVLDQARQRLEAELERDEHWRALQMPLASAGANDLAAEKEARDRRLRLALETNPVYIAWRNVVEASATLQKTGASDSELEGLVVSSEAVPAQASDDTSERTKPLRDRSSLSAALQDVLADEGEAGSGNDGDPNLPDGLPPEIAALIRQEVKAGAAMASLSESDRELHAVGERAARAVEKLLAIPSVEPVAPEHLETARRADRLANELREINERRRARAAANDEREITTETAPTERRGPSPSDPAEDADFMDNPAGAPWVPFDGLSDPEETVATVMARPEHQPSVPAQEPVRRGTLVERLRAEETSVPAPPPVTTRTPRLDVTHEAEVTVVRKSPEILPKSEEQISTIAQHPPLQDHKSPQRPFRRLINVLTGK